VTSTPNFATTPFRVFNSSEVGSSQRRTETAFRIRLATRKLDFRFGSFPEVGGRIRQVRSAPRSGHYLTGPADAVRPNCGINAGSAGFDSSGNSKSARSLTGGENIDSARGALPTREKAPSLCHNPCSPAQRISHASAAVDQQYSQPVTLVCMRAARVKFAVGFSDGHEDSSSESDNENALRFARCPSRR
jgi:hypothetical protein